MPIRAILDFFNQGIVVIPAYLAKGLEFDTVSIGKASPFIVSIKSDLYVVVTV
jgi:DNA helicase IV